MAQPRSFLFRSITPETLWLSAICMADLASTLYWLAMGQAREGNPIMAWFLQGGVSSFIAGKIVMFAPALILAEWYRPRNPELITRVMR